MSNLQSLEQRMDRVDYQVVSDDKDKRIADLEAKLVENETEIKSLSSEISSLEQDLTHYKGEVFNLKDQIAKKVAEIEDVKNWWSYQYEGEKQRHNQDKISFAVEQFEKLKEKVICGVLDTSNDFWDFTLKNGDAYILDDALLDLLEQEFTYQIKELKKEMK